MSEPKDVDYFKVFCITKKAQKSLKQFVLPSNCYSLNQQEAKDLFIKTLRRTNSFSRNESIVKFMFSFCSKMQYFQNLSNNFGEQLVVQLMQYLTYDEFSPEQFLIEQGEKQSKLLLLLQGEVNLFVDNEPISELDKDKTLNATLVKRIPIKIKLNHNNKRRRTLSSGKQKTTQKQIKIKESSFTQAKGTSPSPISSQSTTAATPSKEMKFIGSIKAYSTLNEIGQRNENYIQEVSYKAVDQCKLAVLDGKIFRKLVQLLSSNQINERIEFFRNYTFFDGISNSEMKYQFALSFNKMVFTRGQEVFRENERDINDMYFVVDGSFEMQTQLNLNLFDKNSQLKQQPAYQNMYPFNKFDIFGLEKINTSLLQEFQQNLLRIKNIQVKGGSNNVGIEALQPHRIGRVICNSLKATAFRISSQEVLDRIWGKDNQIKFNELCSSLFKTQTNKIIELLNSKQEQQEQSLKIQEDEKHLKPSVEHIGRVNQSETKEQVQKQSVQKEQSSEREVEQTKKSIKINEEGRASPKLILKQCSDAKRSEKIMKINEQKDEELLFKKEILNYLLDKIQKKRKINTSHSTIKVVEKNNSIGRQEETQDRPDKRAVITNEREDFANQNEDSNEEIEDSIYEKDNCFAEKDNYIDDKKTFTNQKESKDSEREGKNREREGNESEREDSYHGKLDFIHKGQNSIPLSSIFQQQREFFQQDSNDLRNEEGDGVDELNISKSESFQDVQSFLKDAFYFCRKENQKIEKEKQERLKKRAYLIGDNQELQFSNTEIKGTTGIEDEDIEKATNIREYLIRKFEKKLKQGQEDNFISLFGYNIIELAELNEKSEYNDRVIKENQDIQRRDKEQFNEMSKIAKTFNFSYNRIKEYLGRQNQYNKMFQETFKKGKQYVEKKYFGKEYLEEQEKRKQAQNQIKIDQALKRPAQSIPFIKKKTRVVDDSPSKKMNSYESLNRTGEIKNISKQIDIKTESLQVICNKNSSCIEEPNENESDDDDQQTFFYPTEFLNSFKVEITPKREIETIQKEQGIAPKVDSQDNNSCSQQEIISPPQKSPPQNPHTLSSTCKVYSSPFTKTESSFLFSKTECLTDMLTISSSNKARSNSTVLKKEQQYQGRTNQKCYSINMATQIMDNEQNMFQKNDNHLSHQKYSRLFKLGVKKVRQNNEDYLLKSEQNTQDSFHQPMKSREKLTNSRAQSSSKNPNFSSRTLNNEWDSSQQFTNRVTTAESVQRDCSSPADYPNLVLHPHQNNLKQRLSPSKIFMSFAHENEISDQKEQYQGNIFKSSRKVENSRSKLKQAKNLLNQSVNQREASSDQQRQLIRPQSVLHHTNTNNNSKLRNEERVNKRSSSAAFVRNSQIFQEQGSDVEKNNQNESNMNQFQNYQYQKLHSAISNQTNFMQEIITSPWQEQLKVIGDELATIQLTQRRESSRNELQKILFRNQKILLDELKTKNKRQITSPDKSKKDIKSLQIMTKEQMNISNNQTLMKQSSSTPSKTFHTSIIQMDQEFQHNFITASKNSIPSQRSRLFKQSPLFNNIEIKSDINNEKRVSSYSHRCLRIDSNK